MKKKLLTGFAIGCSALIGASISGATTLNYNILEIGDFPYYTNTNISDTYSGTGFVGIYPDKFVHLFGIEQTAYSRTALQVDVSALAGFTINNAYLTFDLLNGSHDTQNVTFSSFDANGILGHFWNITAIDTQTSAIKGLSSNSVDVTNLLTNRLATGDNWFGLHLQGTDAYQWSYTSNIYNPDSAHMRLVVDYGTAPVPEPTTMLLFGTGLVGLLGNKIRKKK